jgi:hypothetical protein
MFFNGSRLSKLLIHDDCACRNVIISFGMYQKNTKRTCNFPLKIQVIFLFFLFEKLREIELNFTMEDLMTNEIDIL